MADKKVNSKIENIYELSSMQEGMLYHKLLDEKHDSYFVQNVLVLNSHLNQENIKLSLKLLAEKYETLRTMVFYRKAQKPRLIVLKEREIEFNAVDSKTDDKSLPVYKSADLNRGFDLEKDSLMRVTYVEYSNSSAMIWSFHHIIMDGWCLSIILNDFIRFYEALSNKAPYQKLLDEVLLEKKSIPSYGALAAWKKRQNREVSMSYWNNLLADFDTATVIQPDVTEDNSDTSDMHVLQNFDCEQSALIEQFAKKNGVTVSNVVEAAYGIVLQKYMNTPDVVFGKVVSGRNADILGIESAVGLFINTIPVRVTTNDSMTCEELLRNVMIESVESTSHDYCPLVDIQQQTIVGKNLINSLLVYENYFIDKYPESISNISFSVDEQVEGTNYPITLSAHFTDRLELKIMYKSNMFSATFVEKLLNQICTVISTIVSAPHMRVQEIELMSGDEKEKILSTFNDTFAQYSHLSLPELFEAAVNANESKTALVTSSEILSYRELNNRANIIADTLSTKGIVSGDTVAILLNRTANMIAAVLGVLKAGACYLPIDPEFPVERINYIVDNSSAKCVITEQENVGKIVNAIDVVDVHQFDYSVNNQYHGNYCELFEYPAYCIYTSGSTGNPKGVYVSHKNISNLIQWQLRTQNYRSERILASTKITFDVATQEIMFALLGGKTLILTPDGLKENIAEFLSFSNEHCADTMFTTPSYLDVVCSNESNAKQLTGTVKTFILAGEAFYINSILKPYVGKKGYTFINQYGPSETHVATSAVIDDVSNVNIGKPIDNAKIYILDNSNRLSSIGMIGELCIAGDCVGLGYANMPELTEQKFTIFAETNEKIYRTGDLARWLPDGRIEYIGRNDFQVKIRGLRVELGEIEKKLLSISGVQNALVLVKKDSNEMQFICAYYVSDPEIDEGVIKEELGRALPQYMIPNAIMRLDAMPLNNNGKVDRKKLPEIRIESLSCYRAPETELEKQVAELFAASLGVDRVGIDDDFFELGGHSLKATKLVNQIENLTGKHIVIQTLFENPTVSSLCGVIEEIDNSRSEHILPADTKEEFCMSSVQERLFFINEIDNVGVSYNMPACFEITDEIDLDRLNDAFNKLVSRHEALRTIYYLKEGKGYQKVLDNVPAKIEIKENSAFGGNEELVSEIKSFVQPFNLGEAPLMRVEVLLFASKKYILFDMHHMITDGESMNVLVRDLFALYEGKNLEPLKVQYKDYCEWMDQRDFTNQKAYWCSQFEDNIPVLNLPTDKSRPKIKDYSGYTLSVKTSNSLQKKIKEFAQSTQTTEFMVLLSAFGILLSKYSRQDDIVVGSPVSGRTNIDTENMIGMFVNTLALRTHPKKDKSYCEYLSEVKKTCLGAYENQDYPFENLIENLNIKRDLSRNPLFDVMFALQNMDDSSHLFSNSGLSRVPISRTSSKFDINAEVYSEDGEYRISFEYSTAIFNSETVEWMLSHYVTLLNSILSAPNKKIGDISLISCEEESKILKEFNKYDYDSPTKSVIQLFHEQVESTPTNVALRSKDEILTYVELNSRANKLQRTLKKYKVRSGDYIVLSMERSVDLIVSLLAILKLGGVYVVIDAKYPKERKQYIIDDCAPRVILVDSNSDTFDCECEIINVSNCDYQSMKLDTNLKVNTAPSDLAYMIYTSGTTGKPKGAMIENQSIVRLVKNPNYVELNDSTIMLQAGSVAFDASTFEIWGALLNGGTLCLAGQDTFINAGYLQNTINEYQVNTMWLTASLFNQIVDDNAEVLNSLRYLLIGGEKLSEKHVNTFLEKCSSVILINGYGPTENTTFTSTYRIDKLNSRIPIGTPINGTQIYVMDDGNLCGIGVPGELCTTGLGVGRGYLNNQSLTEQKFIPNPFGSGTMYCSGDVVRWLPDGNIDYLGRTDEQIKLRGYRIELEDIKTALQKITGVKQAAVIFDKQESEEGEICAYIVAETELSVHQIKEELRNGLPEYMIPAGIMLLDELPITKNGKLDKSKLPRINIVREKEYIAPQTELEQIVADIFSEVLDVDMVGASDDFFDLGGHSLKANKLISVIESKTGVRLGLTKIFSNSTVSAIANEIEKEALLLKTQYIEPNHVKKTLNCVQRRIFFLDELEKNAINNIILHTNIKGTLDVQTVEANIKTVVDKNDVLRTVFSLENGLPIQKIYENIDFVLDYVDFRGFEPSECNSIISKFNVQFEKSKAPLFKVKLYQIQDEEFVFVLAAHPLILDESSAKNFASLCLQGYDTNSDNVVQGTDYEIPQSENDKKYWLEKFQFDIPKLNLPTDFARKAMVGHETKSIRVSIPEERISQINEMCQSSMVGKESIFLAAYYLLLCHYSRQNDIVIGLDHINEHTRHSLGNFRNTLPLLVDIEHKDLTIDGILETISAIVAEARTHANYQYEMMIDELNVERDASRNPLYDVKFSYMEEKMSEQEGKEFIYHHNYTNVGSDALDIALFVHTSLNDSYVEVYYNANLFKDAFINVFLNRLLVIIDQLIVNSQVKCENIDYLVSGEKETILNVFNTDNRVISVENTFSERLDTIAQKYSCKTALVCEDISITYQELIKQVNAVAAVLRKRGVNRNSLVPIVMQRSIDAIIALCAVIKSGGAYVPIDPEYPDDRILYTLKDCSAELVISDGRNIPGYEVINIAEVLREVEPIDQLECINSSDDPMYVIYTSGTTGKPKGVVVQHRGIMNLVAYEADRMGIISSDVILQTASLSFDASVLEIIWALSYGATLCICPPHITHDVKQFEQYVKDNKVSVSILTPQHYSQVSINGLRILATGGAAANSSVVEKCINSGTKYINLYGPTEATIFATDWLYSEENVIPDVIPIGKPIDNIQIYIMNNVDLCGVGVPGELCIAGLGVTSGYLNRQELTNEKYIMNPFGTGRLYRTGDLARWLEDGNIEYLGRVDRQVKVRGFRIELGEIENAIRTTEGVVDAVVTVAKVGPESIIAAYIVSETEFDEMMIRKSLHKTLPDYMLPSFICRIDAIPLTTNGKINYKALPKAELQSTTEYIAPRNDTELILAESFKEVLQYEKIGIDDNFFELGGDSLKSMQLVNVLYDKQFALTVKDIMQYPSIRELAPNIVKVEKEINVMQAEISGEIPLIPIQKAFFDWKLKEPTHFNHALMVEIKNKVDIASFCKAWQAIVEHHDMLRTYFVDGKQYVASCEQFGKLDINHFDYSEIDNAEQLVVCRNNEIQKSFDLSGGKLIRVALYSLKDCDQMFVCLHHLIVDNVSWEIILHDFKSAYEQCVSGQSIALPLKTVSYKKWAEDLSEYAYSSQLMDEVPYWHGVEKAVADTVLFPKTEPGGIIQEVFHSFDSNIASKLVFETTKVCGVELRDILLTALAYTVKLWKNSDVCSVMLEGYGREDLLGTVNTDRTVGWFTTLYPFALPNVNSCTEPKEYMQLIHNSLRNIPKRGIGYSILKYLSDVPMGEQEPEVCFNFMDSAGGFSGSQGWNQSGIDTGVNISERNARPQHISFDISLHNGVLDVVVAFNNAVCSEGEILRMLELYEQMLNQAVTIYTYTEAPSEKMNKLIQSGYASDPLRAQVGNAILQYEENISRSQEVLSYNPTNYQKSFLMTRKNIAVERFAIPSGYTLEDIVNGVIMMVNEQDALRSYAKLGEDANIIICVNDTCESWDIPIVSSKADLEEAINEFPDLFSNGTLLAKIILQQLSETKYQIVLIAQHAVWDKSSSDIFQSRLIRYLINPHTKQEVAMPYYTYAQSLDRPNSEETSDDGSMIGVVHKWSAAIPKLEEINTMRIRVKLSKERLQDFLADPVMHAFKYTCYGLFGAGWQSFGDVPITAIHHGRNDKNQSTLGMFLDVIPVVVNTGLVASGDMGISPCIQQAIAALSNGSLYSQTASDRIMQFVDIIPCLNFIGVLTDETDLDYLQEGEYQLINYELASFDVNIRVLGSTVEAIFPYRTSQKNDVIEYVRKDLLK